VEQTYAFNVFSKTLALEFSPSLLMKEAGLLIGHVIYVDGTAIREEDTSDSSKELERSERASTRHRVPLDTAPLHVNWQRLVSILLLPRLKRASDETQMRLPLWPVKRGLCGVSGAPPPSFDGEQPPSRPMGKWTALILDAFSYTAAYAGSMVTKRHQNILSNEADRLK